jgi:hypothetical protein
MTSEVPLENRLQELYRLLITWIKHLIRRPISNWLSKAAFIVGALIVSTPLIEHLLFSALLKQTLGIDLGISVPDTNAYIAGSLIMICAMLHNLIFVKLNQDYAVAQSAQRNSDLRTLWNHVDTMLDDTVRLTGLYCTDFKKSDEAYATTADNSIIRTQDFARKNRPFLLSDDIYKKVLTLSIKCIDHTRSFWACLRMKKKNTLDYDFALAQKTISAEYNELKVIYDEICKLIEDEIVVI